MKKNRLLKITLYTGYNKFQEENNLNWKKCEQYMVLFLYRLENIQLKCRIHKYWM